MTQTVRLTRCNADGTAQVIHVRQSACSGDCHQCAGCGAAKETLVLTARNPIGAKTGDLVVIQSGSGPVLAAAALLYMLPLVLFFLGYLVGAVLWDRGGLSGCCAFALGILGAVVYGRSRAARKNTEYTITGYAGTHTGGA